MRTRAASVAVAVAAISAPEEAASREGGTGMARLVRRETGKVWLDGLGLHEVRINQLGNLLACARYLGYEQPKDRPAAPRSRGR